MKKKFILPIVCAILLTTGIGTVNATEPDDFPPPPPHGCPCIKNDRNCKMNKADFEKMKKIQEKRKTEFENRLKLTKEQKEFGRVNRQKGHEEMKPIMEQIKAKHELLRDIDQSTASAEIKAQQKAAVKAELKTLKAQANEIREKNMKAFEATLTEKQKKELNKIKEEHKKEFKKRHGQKPPCNCPPRDFKD